MVIPLLSLFACVFGFLWRSLGGRAPGFCVGDDDSAVGERAWFANRIVAPTGRIKFRQDQGAQVSVSVGVDFGGGTRLRGSLERGCRARFEER